MPALPNYSLYEGVVRITRVYLGPAAGRFIDRQVENHLHKAPAELTPADLMVLIDWLKISVSHLTEDSEIVEEYVSELHKLADEQAKPKRGKGKS